MEVVDRKRHSTYPFRMNELQTIERRHSEDPKPTQSRCKAHALCYLEAPLSMLSEPKADTGTNPSCFSLVASLSRVLSLRVLNCLHPLQGCVSPCACGLAAINLILMGVLCVPLCLLPRIFFSLAPGIVGTAWAASYTDRIPLSVPVLCGVPWQVRVQRCRARCS